jgi:transposase-like protein
MPRSGPRKLYRYSDEFKLTAVRLSQPPGTQVQTVAAALEIHPFMLSKWRKDVRMGGSAVGRERHHRLVRRARSLNSKRSNENTRSSKRSMTS